MLALEKDELIKKLAKIGKQAKQEAQAIVQKYTNKTYKKP
jgi:hypothetical protein